MTRPQSCRTLHAYESLDRIGGVQTLIQDWMDADPTSCGMGLLDREATPPNPVNRIGLRRTRIDSINKIRSKARGLDFSCRTMICHNFHGLHALTDLIRWNRLVLYLHTNSDDVWARLKKSQSLWDAIITSGQSLAAEVRSRVFPLKIPILPAEYPLSKNFFSIQKKTSNSIYVIGYAGRIVVEQKRPERLLPFCRHLCDMGVNYVLEIAGNGPSQRALQKGLAGFPVKFLGPLNRKEMADAFSRWDLQVNTSDYETGPLTILEGMAAGVIPLMPNIECQARELLQFSLEGCLYEKGNMAEAARLAVGILRQTENESNKMRAIIKSLVQGRSIEAYLIEIKEFLDLVNAGQTTRSRMSFRNNWMDMLPLFIRCKLPQGSEILY